MGLDFVGVDPDNPDDQCPAVFVDPETGDFYMQGETVTDPEMLAWINSDSRILDTESVVMLPGAHGGDHLGGGQWRLRTRQAALPCWRASPA